MAMGSEQNKLHKYHLQEGKDRYLSLFFCAKMMYMITGDERRSAFAMKYPKLIEKRIPQKVRDRNRKINMMKIDKVMRFNKNLQKDSIKRKNDEMEAKIQDIADTFANAPKQSMQEVSKKVDQIIDSYD